MPETLTIRPMQWAILPELAAAPPLDASDLACLSEIRDVLARHGRLDRFALHLAHRHFELEPNEILIERPDPDGRTQHVTVGRREDAPDAIPTTWLFEDGPVLRMAEAVYCVCQSDPVYAAGCVEHGKSSSPGPVYEREKAILQRRIAEDKAKYDAGIPVAGHGPKPGHKSGS